MIAKKRNIIPRQTTLVSPQAMGGLHGGNGYTFQDRYIVCHIPAWLSDPKFVRLMPEGSGDVDVVFAEGRKHFYDHVQVKDHAVNNGDFTTVIKTFVDFEKATGKAYRKFILTCPLVSNDVKSFNDKLTRYREFHDNMFDPESKKALASTKQDLNRIFNKFGIDKYFEFALAKVFLEINAFDFHNNTVCKRQFAAALSEHPKYKEKFDRIMRSAYAQMISEVLAHRGKVLQKGKIQSLINDSIAGKKSIFKTTVLQINNWSQEKFDLKPNISIDWTQHFDRQNKIVPDQMVWDSQLIPELLNTRKSLAARTSNRQIVLRGKIALSTCIALGMLFPEIGDWTFELMQPPLPDPWRSDADKISDYQLSHREIIPGLPISKSSREIAIVFSITGKAVPDVSDHFASQALPLKRIISIEPEKGTGNSSIENDSEAVSLAAAAKDLIKQMIIKHKATKLHLFYFGPAGLAIFLGQKLTSIGPIQLYEYLNPGYKPSCLIKS